MMKSRLSLSILLVFALACVGLVACAGVAQGDAWSSGSLTGTLLRVEGDGSRVYRVSLQPNGFAAGVVAQDFACALLLTEPSMSIRLISDTEFEMTVQPDSEPPKRISPISPDALGLRVRINARGAYLEGDVEQALLLFGGALGATESIADHGVPLSSGALEAEQAGETEQAAAEVWGDSASDDKSMGNGLLSDPWVASQHDNGSESQIGVWPEASIGAEPSGQSVQVGEHVREPAAAVEPLAAQEPAAGRTPVERKVIMQRDMPDDIREGDEFSIKATLVGYDGLDYALQWQYDSGLGEGWKDMPGADRPELRLIANAENVHYDWRILVSYVEPE